MINYMHTDITDFPGGGNRMALTSWDEEWYEEYMEDVRIARMEIENMKLYPSEALICDMYALPSHNFQTYYAMLYEHHGRWEMVYAKPQIYRYQYAEPVKMYSFSTSRKVQEHFGDGRIIIGIRHLPDEFVKMVKNIIENLPDNHVLGEGVIMIDGALQAIRVFDGDTVVKEVVYYLADMVPLKDQKEWMTKQLEELYLLVGKMIQGT